MQTQDLAHYVRMKNVGMGCAHSGSTPWPFMYGLIMAGRYTHQSGQTDEGLAIKGEHGQEAHRELSPFCSLF